MTVIFFILCALLGIFIILLKIFQNQIIGRIGENHTAKIIQSETNGQVFRDIYANGSYGVQQIDIIAVTPKGVLVVEKKTYIGLILGTTYEKQWKVITGHGRQRFSMKNPHHQNFGHIQALIECIPQLKDKCIDLVIFGNNAKLGNKIPANTIRDNDFKKFYEDLPVRLSADEITQIAIPLKKLEKSRKSNKKQHRLKIQKFRSSGN